LAQFEPGTLALEPEPSSLALVAVQRRIELLRVVTMCLGEYMATFRRNRVSTKRRPPLTQGHRDKSKGPESCHIVVQLVNCINVARTGRDLEGSSGGVMTVIGKGKAKVHSGKGHEAPEGE